MVDYPFYTGHLWLGVHRAYLYCSRQMMSSCHSISLFVFAFFCFLVVNALNNTQLITDFRLFFFSCGVYEVYVFLITLAVLSAQCHLLGITHMGASATKASYLIENQCPVGPRSLRPHSRSSSTASSPASVLQGSQPTKAHSLTILVISHRQKPSWKYIWRRNVHQNTTKISPSNILSNYFLFTRYC